MSQEAFDRVRDQVAACGIWCGSCAAGNGVLSDLAARYAQLLKDYGITEWGPKEIDYETFFQNLESLKEVDGCPGCQRGGGFEGCPMKPCAAERKLPECLACDEYGTCERSEAVEKVRKGAIAAKMVVKTVPGDASEQIDRWVNSLQGTWPNGVMFLSKSEPDVPV